MALFGQVSTKVLQFQGLRFCGAWGCRETPTHWYLGVFVYLRQEHDVHGEQSRSHHPNIANASSVRVVDQNSVCGLRPGQHICNLGLQDIVGSLWLHLDSQSHAIL